MDAQQFQNNILCYSDNMYRMALSILRDENMSRDAYQELMTRLWVKRKQLEKLENPRAFLLTSMRNLCIDLLRKERESEEVSPNSEYIAPNPHQLAEQSDSVSFICKMIDSLPEMQRTIVRMKDVEDLDISEIAEVMQITENAVMVTLSRGRKKLREIIMTYQQKERLVYEKYR